MQPTNRTDRHPRTFHSLLPIVSGDMSRAIRAHVVGQVQRVGYRQSCRRIARSLDLVGWVRNHSDGSVEILAQGESGSVDRLVEWAWTGPVSAAVIGVESETVPVDPNLTDFFIYPDPEKSR